MGFKIKSDLTSLVLLVLVSFLLCTKSYANNANVAVTAGAPAKMSQCDFRSDMRKFYKTKRISEMPLSLFTATPQVTS